MTTTATTNQAGSSNASAACADSPTGAHHWIISVPDSEMSGECKYCGKARTFRPFQEETGFNNSPKKRAA